MKINFPANCNTEASRWSFCIKLHKVLILEHNNRGLSFRDKKSELYDCLIEHEQYVNSEVVLAPNSSEWDRSLPIFKDGTPINILNNIHQLKVEMDSLLKSFRDFQNGEFKAMHDICMLERNKQIEIARAGVFWNPKIPDHVSDGIITYPTNLNQNNEGSRASFLFGLEQKLIDRKEDNMDKISVREALLIAKQDAIEATIWNPTIGDII